MDLVPNVTTNVVNVENHDQVKSVTSIILTESEYYRSHDGLQIVIKTCDLCDNACACCTSERPNACSFWDGTTGLYQYTCVDPCQDNYSIVWKAIILLWNKTRTNQIQLWLLLWNRLFARWRMYQQLWFRII